MVSLYYYKQQSQEFYTQKAEGQHSTVILRAGEEAERWGFQGQARPHSQTLLHIKTKQNKQQNSQHKGTERILNLKLWGHVLSKIPISSLSLHPLQVRFEASSWSGHTHLLVPAVVGEKARLQFDWLSHQISGCQIRDPWGLKRAKDTRDPPLSPCPSSPIPWNHTFSFPGIPCPPPRNLGQLGCSLQQQNLPLSETFDETHCQIHNQNSGGRAVIRAELRPCCCLSVCLSLHGINNSPNKHLIHYSVLLDTETQDLLLLLSIYFLNLDLGKYLVDNNGCYSRNVHKSHLYL